MKKILLIIVSLSVVYATATAQDLKKDIFGVRVGFNLSTATMLYQDSKVTPDSKLGINLGFSYQRLLSTGTPVYFETGLFFSDEGIKIKNERTHITSNLDLMYLKIPLILNYHIAALDNNQAIKPFAGLYLSHGIGGKSKKTGETSINSFSKGMFNTFDFGFKLGTGLAVSKFYFCVTYELGLANISADNETDAKNRNWAFSIGYNF
ncbi:MAG: PorT family protein [Prevotellaceae bacterium]|jgi:opacity protein-like surface antigen|nr:PorT family protein [Prevotellaceae bacterium]